MKNNAKYGFLVLTSLFILALGVAALAASSAKAANTAYYVDCSAGSNGSGTQSSPWNNLATVNGTTFGAGDQILFKRGTVCSGQLYPKGSGVSGNPLKVDAYGTGARPTINNGANTNDAVYFNNQSYLEVANLDTVGNVKVSGSSGTVEYIRLTNMNALGSFYIMPWAAGARLNDVILDNVVAHDSQDVGIGVYGPCCNLGTRNTNVYVRNSMAYNTPSDGIVVFDTNGGAVSNSVAYNTGTATTNPNGWHSPNAIWTWDTDSMIVENTETYLNSSFGKDGGSYDIDYYNSNNIVQYNYGHDNIGYCVSVFGAERTTTTSSVVRYNICSNNDQRAGDSAGDIILFTWTSGKINGVKIYNNTTYWNPADTNAAAYVSGATFTGTLPNFFRNNIIYAAAPRMTELATITLDYNLYWHTGGAPVWKYGGKTYTTFAAYQSGSGQDAHGKYADPLLNSPTYHGVGMPTNQFALLAGSPAINAGTDVGDMGSHDFFGNPIPSGGAYDIGAYESGGAPLPTATFTNTPLPTNTPTAGPSPTPTNTSTPIPSGANLALNKPAAVSSYASTTEMGDKAVDDLTTTYWRTKSRSTLPAEWISVDLGSVVNVSRVKFSYNSSRYPTAYTVQVSTDNINWTTVVTVTGGTGNIEHTFTSVPARYVRQYSTAWYSGDRVRIVEFEIYQ